MPHNKFYLNLIFISFFNLEENEISYKCTTCGSDAVIEEDESVLPNKNNVNYSSSLEKKTQTEFKTLKVTQSPSESSIGIIFVLF